MTEINWSSLHHAYGPASDIPALLAQAGTAAPPSRYTDEPWFTLWSALYHQDDIFSASFAALPILVDIAAQRGGAIAAETLFLAASIELRRNEPGSPEVPAFLREDYDRALVTARSVSADLFRTAPDPHGKLEVAAVVFAGDFDRAREILDEDLAEEPIVPPNEEL